MDIYEFMDRRDKAKSYEYLQHMKALDVSLWVLSGRPELKKVRDEYINLLRDYGAVTPQGYIIISQLAKNENCATIRDGSLMYLDNRIAQTNAQVSKEEYTPSESLTMTVEEFAISFGISKPTAYKLIKKESFPCFKVGKKILINRAKVQEWMNQHSGGKGVL